MTAMDDNVSWITQFKSGIAYNEAIISDDTRRNYLACLRRFSDYAKMNPDQLIAFKLQGQQNMNTEKEFQAEDLVDNFLPTQTLTMQRLHLIAIKTFFDSTRGRSLDKTVGKTLKKKLKKYKPKKRSPKLEDIIALDENMESDRDKALVWFVESCPLRKGTINQTLWSDLKETGDPEVPFYVEIESERLKGQYAGAKHIGFIHWFAAQKLEKYKQELKLHGIEIKPNSPIFMALRDCRLRNREGKVVTVKKGDGLYSIAPLFTNASLKAWGNLDEKRFSVHDIRDFLQSVMENPDVGLNSNLIKPFLSHVVGGTDGHYSSHQDSQGNADIAEYLKAYKKALPYIIPKTVQQVEAKLEDSNKTIATQQTQIDQQAKENQELKAKIDDINDKLSKLFNHEYPMKVTGIVDDVDLGEQTVNNPQEFFEWRTRAEEMRKKPKDSK